MRKIVWLTQNASPIAQYSTLGFHLMKVALWNQIVAPPSTTTSAKVIHSIMSTFLRLASSQVICTPVAMITTIVASSAEASSVPTTPPETMKPK